MAQTEAREHRDVRIATIGNVDSGKSTLVGVLTKGQLDDGRGSARSTVFNYKHEADVGRTSSISYTIMGFDGEKQTGLDKRRMNKTNQDKNQSTSTLNERGNQLNHESAANRTLNWRRLVSESEHTVTFMDLCGHEKYLKTTIHGLVGCFPDYAMIVVGANMGVQMMTIEHIGIALGMQVPVFIVVTKIDTCPLNRLKETCNELKNILKKANKSPISIRTDQEEVAARQLTTTTNGCPIFYVSNVTGDGLHLLKRYISHLKSRVGLSPLYGPPNAEVAEFHIEGSVNVHGVGCVGFGMMKAGTIRVNDQLLLGPLFGGFKKVRVVSIHSQRVPVQSVSTGDPAAFNLKPIGKNKETLRRSHFRKGTVLLSLSPTGKGDHHSSSPDGELVSSLSSSYALIREFEAEVEVLHHSTTIKVNYQAQIHCGVVQQAARVVDIKPLSLTQLCGGGGGDGAGGGGDGGGGGGNGKPRQSSLLFTDSMKENKDEARVNADTHKGEAEPYVVLRTKDKGRIRFRWMYHPEYVKVGMPIVFREGRPKGIGRITAVYEK
eukprot:GHVN01079145.1.p1 GENE.GHVN01079145.1~~GHVN01079145.1.p1  ORF type:complete len:548 (+),score=90.42 GHVN01079145.1:501-2144(+)